MPLQRLQALDIVKILLKPLSQNINIKYFFPAQTSLLFSRLFVYCSAFTPTQQLQLMSTHIVGIDCQQFKCNIKDRQNTSGERNLKLGNDARKFVRDFPQELKAPWQSSEIDFKENSSRKLKIIS
ncbi:CLUMA_CG010085, isoform A [Clunio marinus]|uniref:CLUMA_CG010085, isoform A n=1 Tax=Clunio marinus TaxID=568069 RepID=A0A1J1IE13_9DIPT|nr:CLUMA_CG010085, isoform A [Clunio marinus]